MAGDGVLSFPSKNSMYSPGGAIRLDGGIWTTMVPERELRPPTDWEVTGEVEAVTRMTIRWSKCVECVMAPDLMSTPWSTSSEGRVLVRPHCRQFWSSSLAENYDGPSFRTHNAKQDRALHSRLP